jgi:hypothetical protein
MLIPKCVLCIDDQEEAIINDKSTTRQMAELSKITVHHGDMICILTLQSYDCFYRKSPLNGVLQNTTKLILFKSISNYTSIKRWLNNYDIKLKLNQTLFDVYRNLVKEERYAYLIVDLSPSLKSAEVYTNILFSDPRPFLVFHVEKEIDDV